MSEHSSACPSDCPAATRSHPTQSPSLEAIQKFAEDHRLKTRVNSDDGTRIIPGKLGHIYEYSADALGVVVTPSPPRRRYWGCVRTTLLEAGFTLVQDGDGEGAATFDPNHPTQAKAAIRAAGVNRKRRISLQRREQLIASLRSAKERHLGA